MSSLFLGVDGGQSSTKALIGDADGRVLGHGAAGPCNHVSSDEARAKFLRTIGECVSAARATAGIAPNARFRAACFGMSGGPEDKASLLRGLIDADDWLVTHDGLIALSGALAGDDGIVVIAGTGSLAFGRHDSRTMRAGGWGYLFGDEGSAFWIVKQALGAALRDEEGWGPKTGLLPMLLHATGTSSADDLLHRFYTPEWPRSRVARLASEVDRVAESGDPVAVKILGDAGRKLAEFVTAIGATLWPANDAAMVTASYIGGVFRSRTVLESFREVLEGTRNMRVQPPVWGADRGALLEAYRLAGIQPIFREG